MTSARTLATALVLLLPASAQGQRGQVAIIIGTSSGEIQVDEPVRSRALGCIERMLDFVKAHPHSVAQPRSGFVSNIGVA